jgi:hypothetical protein
MEDSLLSWLMTPAALVTGVEVAIPAREAATGNLNSNAVSAQKNVACRPEVDLAPAASIGVSRNTSNPIAQVEGAAVRMDVAEARDPVGGRRRAVCVERDLDSPGHYYLLDQ